MNIIVEGIDGSGKTYFIEHIKKLLSMYGIRTRSYSENSIPEIKTIINKTYNSKYNPYTHLFLAVASYLILQEEVFNEHNKGTVIFWDRYIPSTIVYSKVLGVDQETIYNSVSSLNENFVDMKIFCNVLPDVAIKRKKVIDILEAGFQNQNECSFLEFQTKIYNEFWGLINEEPDSWFIYNGTDYEKNQIIKTILQYQNEKSVKNK